MPRGEGGRGGLGEGGLSQLHFCIGAHHVHVAFMTPCSAYPRDHAWNVLGMAVSSFFGDPHFRLSGFFEAIFILCGANVGELALFFFLDFKIFLSRSVLRN